MFTNQIEHILFNDQFASNNFVGVYSCDRLPNINRRTYSIVVNTDTSDRSGVHWQVIHAENSNAYFFCSLGQRPNTYITRYLQRFSRVYHNTTAPQMSTEYTCGGYSIFIIAMLSRGHRFLDICRLFDLINHDDEFIRHYLYEAHNFELERPSL